MCARASDCFAWSVRCSLQSGQAGFQAGFLAEDRHFQACLGTAAVGVHLRNQRVGRGLLGQAQQALDAALLPAQAQKAQWHRKSGRQGKAPLRVQGRTDHEAQLADQNERQPVLQDRHPFIRRRNGRLALVDALVERFGAANLFGGGLDPHRLVTDHLIAFEDRRHIGVNPVVVTALAAILDNAHPWQALFECAPHVREDRRGNVGVTHQVVRRTDQFLTGKPADLDKIVVAVGDHGGNQPLLSRKGPFALCNGLVITHGLFNPQGFDRVSALQRFY